MTPAEFRKAWETLGLTMPQMADMLGYSGIHKRQQIAKMCDGERTITPQIERLVRAYLSGYRPDDWPRNSN